MITALIGSSRLFAAIIVLGAVASVGAPAQAADAQRCIKAAECHGFLPHFCEVCSNGESACAHWACVHHECVMQTCERSAR